MDGVDKVIVVDTNTAKRLTLQMIERLAENNLLIFPYESLKESDNRAKTEKGVGWEKFNRLMSDLVLGGKVNNDGVEKIKKNGLEECVKLNNGGIVSFEYKFGNLPLPLKDEGDDAILKTCAYIREQLPDKKLILITRDKGLTNRAFSLGFDVQKLRLDEIDIKKICARDLEFYIEPKLFDKFINSGKPGRRYLCLGDFLDPNEHTLYWNQPITLINRHDTGQQAYTKLDMQERRVKELSYVVEWMKKEKRHQPLPLFENFIPNRLQAYVAEYFFDPSIRIVIVTGDFGTGKTTTLATSCLKAYQEKKKYEEGILIFYPQKSHPSRQHHPLYKKIKSLSGEDFNNMEKNKLIDFLDLWTLEGLEIENQICLFNDFNMTEDFWGLKVFGRVNMKNSKFGFSGSIDDEEWNGLNSLIDCFQNFPTAAIINLKTPYRSEEVNEIRKYFGA